MATLIAYQDGNFTGATTFKGLVGGTGSAQETITASTNTTTAYVSSSAFTVTNTHVIEGVMVHCRRLNTTGTVSVALSDDNGTTQTREVTVDAADLPTENSWVFFKFGTTLTGDGGNDYRVQVKGSSAGNAVFFRDGTAGNWARLLRRDTTATIATTDVVYISGERTGAGSVTPITVTMDSTATTSYGAMNIGDAGTVSYGTSASTNYYLRLEGNLNVWGNGTLNIGTSTTRIPSTSTATLEFNCASNVQFGLEAQNGSTVNIYGAEKANTKVLLTADANSGQAVITVEDTTGWAVSDEVAIASTTRTPGQSEKRTISTVDSATQATMTANLGFTHQGTSPYQGEVINLTRNVKIRGTSATLQSYVFCQATSSFTADNAEFFFLGSGTALKRGINSSTTSAGSFSMNNCAMRDFTVTGSQGLTIISGSGSPNIQNCVLFNLNVNALEIFATSGIPVFSNNWILALSSGAALVFQDIGGVITDNRVASGGAGNFFFLEGGASFNQFERNVSHSCSSQGFRLESANHRGDWVDCKSWRSTGGGAQISAPLTLSGFELYHNGSSGLNCGNNVKIINSTFNGGTGQSLAASLRHVDLNGNNVIFENCDFGQTNQATNFLNVTAIGGDATFIDCNIAEGLDPLNRGNLQSATTTPVIGLDKLNSTSGNHRAYKQFGYAGSDQSVFRTASPSEVLVPNSASGKLPSGSKKFGVANGNSATVSVWVRKSSTYNGAEPRLILKRNIVGGVSSDQVLATLSGGTEEWLELTASTPTVTDDCVLEIYVDCDGTAGTVNVDDYSIS
jgi:hypothetical protein